MVGIVAVSHSVALAAAAVEFALTMVHDTGSGAQPKIAIAAGTQDGGFGTDASRVAEAILEVADSDGAVVLCDLGSAVLAAEMGIELAGRDDVELLAAPFAEGLFAAIVGASIGRSRQQVAHEANTALGGKDQAQELIAADTAEEPASETAPATEVPPVTGVLQTVEMPVGAPDALAAVTVINPLGIHARPAAQIAEIAGPFHAKVWISTDATAPVQAVSPTAVLGIDARKGDRVWIEAIGDDAAQAVAAVKATIAAGFGEAVPETTQEITLPATGQQGIGLSPGRVTGKVLHALADLAAPEIKEPLAESRREAEAARIPAAAKEVARDLRARAAESSGATGQVLAATAVLAEDSVMLEDAMARVRLLGERAERAVWEMMSALITQYQRSGGAVAERASDLADLRSRIIGQLTDVEVTTLPLAALPHILVAEDLPPAETAELDPRLCLGLVLARGGPTSHTTIIARSLGIPVVIHPEAVATLRDGDTVVIDGDTGQLLTEPTEHEAATARRAPLVLADLEPAPQPVTLRDGTAVPLLGNIGGEADAQHTVERGGQGVGLFRTEYFFLDRVEAPSLAEQTDIYERVLRAAGGSPVTFRTLDAGSDKPLSFLPRGHEDNSALGFRGIRTAAAHPDLLLTQLTAIAAAAERVGGAAPRVMAPMVTTWDEVNDFVAAARSVGIEHTGVMIETPAAAIMVEEFADLIDFVSIGTNDLTQYTLAADRLLTPLAALNTPWQPSVLRLVGHVVNHARELPVGVCGEAASDPLLAAVLLGLGVTELSMTPSMIPFVAQELAAHSLEECKNAAEAVLTARTADAARMAASQILRTGSA